MFLRRRPSDDAIRAFIAAQAELPFSYRDVGATRGAPPAGYCVDHNRVHLGCGSAVFERAAAALRSWQMFAIDGVELCWPSAPLAVGTTVAVLASIAGLWSLNACRIVYLVDEPGGPLTRRGFAYGTLPEHAVRGEERFLVEWARASDEVTYDLLAFSRPRSPLACARPFLRRAQRRFAQRSLQAMRRAAGEGTS